MIRIGASTANLYPMETEKALDVLLQLGIKTIEIFLNSVCETEPQFVQMLRRKADEAGAQIVSVHPYTSVAEPYLFFTEYERRFSDGLKEYEKLFQVCKALGASYLIMHGDRMATPSSLPESLSLQRFAQIRQLGKRYGVTLLQENVCRNRSRDPAFLRAMRQQLGGEAAFVLDFKQAIRSEQTVDTVLQAMGDRVAHIHISDHDEQHDCLVPGRGIQNFEGIFKQLEQQKFDGAVIIELYRQNYGEPQELVDGICFLQQFVKK